MNRRGFLRYAGATLGTAAAGAFLSGCKTTSARMKNSSKPLNVLIITADDMNFDSVGAFGCEIPDTTPNIDRLAGESMVFENSHVNIAVCMPSRSAVMTGLYPHRSGAEAFQFVNDDVPTLHGKLHEWGYLVGIAGKAHHTECRKDAYWDMRKDGMELAMGRDPKLYYKYADEFFKRANKEDRPFLFVANSQDPHRPYYDSPREKENKNYGPVRHLFAKPSKIFKPEDVTVPEFLPSLPEIRVEMSEYYNSVRRCDDTVGEVLRALDENGLSENTMVIYFSDHGISMPYAKTNCYLNSTKSPFVVRLPGVTKPGARNSRHMVAAIDICPTILDACGLEQFNDFDGRSFLPLLRGEDMQGFERVYTQFHETSARRRYPMRCVQDKEYGYLFNPWSDGEKEFRHAGQGGRTWAAMGEYADKDPFIKKRMEFFTYREVEEFYDLRKDPDCIFNLIDHPDYQEQIKQKRAELREWMVRTGDPALVAFESEEGLKRFQKEQAEIGKQRREEKRKQRQGN